MSEAAEARIDCGNVDGVDDAHDSSGNVPLAMLWQLRFSLRLETQFA